MLGKSSQYIHNKYKNTRKRLQRQKKHNKLVSIKRREYNKTKDLNHKISTKIVKYAKSNKCGIKLEDLTGIRNTTKCNKDFKFSLNSWSYYQIELFIEYKAKLQGVKVSYIEPAYTSQMCSKCGLIGKRNGKLFKCPHCGHTCHADVNASWNICYSDKLLEEPKPRKLSGLAFYNVKRKLGSSSELSDEVYIQRLVKEKDLTNGNTDIPVLEMSCFG
jgi:putative transposase